MKDYAIIVAQKHTLQGADLQGVDLREANLGRANLWGANLGRADLRGANLRRANLWRADLQGANLRGADLRGANLRGADLRGANLGRADLRGADLGRADLRGAKGYDPFLIQPLMERVLEEKEIIAYKIVTENYYSPFVADRPLEYKVGTMVSVKEADTDIHALCSIGINVATLQWCLANKHLDHKIVQVSHTKEDIAAIPIASDGAYRVYRCAVIREVDFAGKECSP